MPLPAEPARVPQFCPSPRELDDLELLSTGALAPLTGFNEPGSPVTLTLPPELVDAPVVELVDPEGLPLARVTHTADGVRTVETLTQAQYGPFRRLYLSPTQVREQYAGRTVVPVTGPVTDAQLAQLTSLSRLGPLLLLAFVGTGTPDLSPVALLRATLRTTELLADAVVVAVALASHDDPEIDHALGVQVTATYAGEDRVLGLVQVGEPIPEIEDIVEADLPPAERQGLVLFFTGLSGSGKSTLAQALMDRLLERGGRTITSLDGDVVRRNLSAGLTFSKADRETNIRRIGWVAAEISRHGGIAVVSPIAPFDETRQQVRAMVAEAGGAFFLVHVATPLEECERRDRKGLYAKARAGEIPEFTGISSPYEEPTDADVRVDTTGRTIEAALDDVINELAVAGYVDLRPVVEGRRKRLPAPPMAPPTAPPLRVHFVCTANICRSPYMELAARALAGDDRIEFTSSGTHGFESEPMDAQMAAALAKRGIDSAGFRSAPLIREHVERADLVVTAEATHRSFVLDDHPTAFRKVLTLGQLAHVVASLSAAGDGVPPSRAALLEQITSRRGPAEQRFDIADPYGRGTASAEKCAELIDFHLAIVVPALVASERI